ncbi:MAG: T9SS type A sorting domain-containing protein, partial [Bacteroidales bacterium]|nr:T9SS type A sorting domain-containing protein [Bacteroidales bacterium]
ITIEVKNSGIEEAKNDNSVQLYPNPATTHVAISSDEPMTYIVIYNSLGQALETINTQGQSMLQLNTARLSGGLYIIGIHTESNKWIRKHLIIGK